MHRLCALIIFLFVSAISNSGYAAEEDGQGRGWALDAKVGTLGIGADLSRSIIPRVLNFRAGASFFPYTTDYSDNGIDYRARLKLGAVPIALDVFPFKNWLRLGGGVVINLTEVDGTGQTSTGTFRIGDHQYSSTAIGALHAKLKANRTVPYFGIGFNNPIKRSGHLGFFCDLGVLYHGAPSAKVSTARVIPELQVDLDKEAREISDDIKDYKYFPVLQLGFSYRF